MGTAGWAERNFPCLVLLAAVAAALSSSCGLVATDPDEQSNPPAESEVEVEPGCRALDLGQATGELAHGQIARQAPAGNPGICAGGVPDASYLWQAPASGCYMLEYAAGAVEYQLNLAANSCSGRSLGCWMSYGSYESFQAEFGQSFVIGVSFEAGADTSEFQLAIIPGCQAR